jgi:polysaccharide deacetylase family protein (PEP-CTERM system associated)
VTSSDTNPAFARLRLELLPPGPPSRALTVDVEDWFHSNFRSAPPLASESLPRRINEGVDRLLEALADGNATGTFFVLGCVAREHPDLVPRIAAAGHEVACHGWFHTLVYEQSPEEFRRTVSEARKLLADLSGQPVWGFRAPSWSITERSLWAFDVLAECGFRYDSSVFPAANYLYGIDGAPNAPYRVHTAAGRTIVEVPPPIVRLGPRRVGVGGGFYLRLFPLWLQRRALRSYADRGAPFLIYVHPREFDPGSWHLRLPLSFSEQLIHRFRLRTTRGKILRLIGEPGWQAVGEMLRRRGVLETAD